GRIDNAGSTTISEAVANGYEVGPNLGTAEEFDYNIDDKLKIYPNPASDVLNVTIISPDAALNVISVYNHTGQLIHQFDLSVSNGAWKFELDLSKYAKGLYSIEYRNTNTKLIKKFVVQ
ncbi:MAG: T9SS type A sorting domain-containing protein, partial [Crocinitomicaceae bacterium]|nr:T9SS type A sorting domain-containing protein [Crocinitomicaceae bacterium]